ncbi:hypothetical protein V6N12_010696 [Hibiscus sabdariffa]|uniref:Transmembrane protein n=1 Tax=Hibiscus sabdariffa TaxID=183260 RepID=A0ABR2EN92_9ROSI
MGVGGFCFDPIVMVLWGKRKVARLVLKVRREMKLRSSKQSNSQQEDGTFHFHVGFRFVMFKAFWFHLCWFLFLSFEGLAEMKIVT